MSGRAFFDPQAPVFIIAEMSANHGGSYENALRILAAAKSAGADAVKLQTYTADSLTIDCDKPCFRIQGTLWAGRTLHELYREAATPWDWQPRLKAAAEEMGLLLFSTPFDAAAVDFLEGMGVPCHKIASFENVDLPLIRKVAATGKPVIMSTGMASEAELDEAVETFREAGGGELALLKCTSAYPAPPEEMHLRSIPYLAQKYGAPTGLSDHTLGIAAPIAAVSLGARIIEKHLCLDRSLPGPDSAFSLEPAEFKAMVDGVREAEKALGRVCFDLTEKQKASAVFRRSLFVVQDMAAGDTFTEKNLRSIRPGHGLHTRHLEDVLGKRAAKAIPRGTPLGWDCAQMPPDPSLRAGARHSAAICGLGNIAWRFRRDADGFPLCHADAFTAHPQALLVGGCDPDPAMRQGFETAHGGRAFSGLEEMLDALNPDIVSICSPPAQHFEHVLTCLERRVPMLWLEKPAAENSAQLRELIARQQSQGNKTTVLVNFQRRYTPCHMRLREALRRQALGRPARLGITYSRGLEPNGIHLLDQIFFLLGEDLGYTVDWASACSGAANPSCGLSTSQGVRVDIQGDDLPYHNIDLQVTCEGGRLSILHGGMTTAVERRIEHERYPGFFRLAPADSALLGPGGQGGAFSTALDDLIQAHSRDGEPASSLRSALLSQTLMERILAGGRP